MVDPSVVFIDGTHIKASANKKKFQKEQVNKAAKVYDEVPVSYTHLVFFYYTKSLRGCEGFWGSIL